MEIKECIRTRRSVRSFLDKKVPHSLIEEIVETAIFAPSWKNSQITRYIVVDDRKLIDEIADTSVLGFEPNKVVMKNAPAILLLTMVNKRSGYERDGSFSTSKEDRWEMFDAGIACQTFCLAAHDEGLGTVIMGVFDEDKVGEVVEIPEGQQLAAIIPIGYPTPEERKAPRRKEAKELLTFK